MNILFCIPSTYSYKGGIERVSSIIAFELKKKGFNCFALTVYDSVLDANSPYKEMFYLKDNNSNIYDFIKNKKIEIIINQMPYDLKLVKKIEMIIGVRIISFFHGSPTFYKDNINLTLYSKYIKIYSKNKIKSLIKKMIYPIFDPYKKAFKISYKISTDFILLSKYFIDDFSKTYDIRDKSKFNYINNPLSFTSFYDGNFSDKERIVLVVSRLSDIDKRISLILQIWQKIEKNKQAAKWRLVIVGGGKDESFLKLTAKKMQLKRCFFEGHQAQVDNYYKKSSIFLMASTNEGWGLSITEAMQYGVVPVAFNTYLSLRDIIINEYNGIIVENGNIDEYKKQIEKLIVNNQYRNNLANNGIVYSKNFSMSIIIKKWMKILK